METAQALSAFLLILLIAESTAAALLKLTHKELFFSARCALGLGIISFILTILAMAGLFSPNLILALSILMTIALLPRRITPLSIKVSHKLTTISMLKVSGIERVLFTVLGIYIIIIFLNCLAPATARDSLNYHLFLPKLWLEEHRIVTLWENIYSFFPHQWNVLYAYALAIGNDITATLLHFLALLLSLDIIYKTGRLIFQNAPRANILASCLIFVSIPSISITSSQPYVDIACVLYLLLSFYFAISYIKQKNCFNFYLSAIFLGCSAAIKYQTLPWLILIPCFFLAQKNPPKITKIAGYFGISLLPILPFAIRNHLACGNAFFPLFNNIFQSPILSPEKNQLYTSLAQSFGFGLTLKDFLLSPWRLIFLGRFDDPIHFDGVIGLAFIIPLALMIFMVFQKNKKTDQNTDAISTQATALILTIYYLLWFITSQQIRFLFFPMAILAILSISVLSIGRHIGIWLITLIAIANLFYPIKLFESLKSYNFIMGRENRTAFLNRCDPFYPIMKKANQICSREKKIMLLFIGNGAYHLNGPVFQESLVENYTLFQILTKNPGSLLSFFQKENIGDIIVNKNIAAKVLHQYRNSKLFFYYQDFMNKKTKVIAEDKTYTLHKIYP